ncbi:MAG: DNA mismatch repair endonuclease MutL [Oscillospiraceae bacterium]|jgi:DNA mismatch repair protein MutL|nr:DNA mismatch repair endonuclease MutL [Oscillospiraceae bacterium]
MGLIKVLDKQTMNLIAAGEVVERPASVLKELVENSIDAGAKRITIELRGNGKRLISVSDDGCGILREDVRSALINHATSKLKNASELEAISTLGFRGEALASICAVSNFELITLAGSEFLGTKYKVFGGEELFFGDFAANKGTCVLVRDIFYNTPARMKFLKKDVAEGNLASSVAEKLALSHPEIAFKLVRDGKEVFSTLGDCNLESVIFCVFGKDFLKKLIYVEHNINNIYIKGFVCDPRNIRSNRSHQIFFLNGRHVKIPIASSALEEAFKGEIQSGKFVACILWLSVVPDSVDVNVHPSKIEVRFANEKMVFASVFDSVKNAMLTHNKRFFYFNDRNFENRLSNSLGDVARVNEGIDFKKLNVRLQKIGGIRKYNTEIYDVDKQQNEALNVADFQNKSEVGASKNSSSFSQNLREIQKGNKEFCDMTNDEFLKVYDFQKNVLILGEIFKCYIIAQIDSEMLLIDKHAAHERIIYEKIKSRAPEACSQELVSPLVTTFDADEYSSIIKNVSIFSKIGYEIEDFGFCKVIIRSVPPYIEVADIVNSISEILNHISKFGKPDITNLNRLYSSIACKSAIKAGKCSSNEEILSLIKDLNKNPDFLSCPHGRPIYVFIKKSELDRYFLR